MAAVVAIRQTAGTRVPDKFIKHVVAIAAQRHPKLRGYSVSVAIVGNTQMRRLNRVYHGVDASTDVLTFLYSNEGVVEIVVCYQQAKHQASMAGWSILRELELLVVHGLLHAIGYNDQRPSDEKRMRHEEAAVLARLRRVG